MMEMVLDMTLLAEDLKCPLDFGRMTWRPRTMAGPVMQCECGAFMELAKVLKLIFPAGVPDFAGGSSLVAEGSSS